MKKAKKGSILVFTLIIMSLILVTALALSTTTLTDRRAASITRSSVSAIQGADSGLEFVLREFRAASDQSQLYHEFVANLKVVANSASIDSDCDESGDYVLHLTDPVQDIYIVAIAKDSDGTDLGPVSCDDSETDPVTEEQTLADILAFKAVGEDRLATRALRIDMGAAIERGIVAFWDFEDYQLSKDADGEYGAVQRVADNSTNGLSAYLCPSGHDDSGCEESNERMHPGGSNKSSYNSGVSWYGTELDKDGDPVDSSDGNGIATSDIDDDDHWGMEFNIDKDGDKEGSPNEYLRVDDDDALDFGKNNFSVSMWIRPVESGKMKFIQKGFGGQKHFAVYKADSDLLSISLGDNSTRTVDEDIVEIATNEWQHISVTFDRDSNAIIYKNGKNEGFMDIRSDDGSITNDESLIIGRDQADDGLNHFIGQMDDIRIYDRVLSQEDVTTLCKQGDGGGKPVCGP